ncbi:hypothetical protein [Vogesella sp. LIG4]|uniref:hypothetical protein n=1 Tax=Vogesella sp. LIG4 TaxID=1192162 RepID=UPI00081FC552|nr:hypothetical protein [Vogesella sp. LIG4]SCK30970.1 hypothetical protein PSELUDRAFT_3859 [Vogesella sp. LIG4]
MNIKASRLAPSSNATPAEPVEPPPLENETLLAGFSTSYGEQLLAASSNGSIIYVFARRSVAKTPQSDFFRIQFQAYTMVQGTQWKKIQGEASDWMNTRNCLQVCVDHPRRSIYFGPRSGFLLSPELANLGLTGYAYAQVIQWLKSHFADYSVAPANVPSPEADGEEARIKRNARLAAQGFDFEWIDSEQRAGRYFKERAGNLISSWETDKVTEVAPNLLLDTVARLDEEKLEQQKQINLVKLKERSLEASLTKERHTNLILTGVTSFVLVFALFRIFGLF